MQVNPKDEAAHWALGRVLAEKGELDGAIAEFQEALHLNPSDGNTHFFLGRALERKGDTSGALREYRAACELEPGDREYRAAYERLSKQISH
jgi:Flp pilus assembly protein TadD